MFGPRNVLRIIASKNEIPSFSSCKNYGVDSSASIKRMFKNVDLQNLLRCNQNAFKNADRQKFFKDDTKYVLSNQLSKLINDENNHYIDASFIFDVDPSSEDKVNDTIRDRDIEKLCDLNTVYFGLPINILCDTVSIIDRFISKVKVKPKYMACLTAACFQLAASNKGYNKKFMSMDNLANLLRCGASGKDLEHMQQIVKSKLSSSLSLVTIHDFLEEFDPEACRDRQLHRIVEAALSKFAICWQRPSRVAVAVLIVYHQRTTNACFGVERLYDLFKSDWDQIKSLSLLINDQYSPLRGNYSRERLLWIISRKTLSSIHVSSVPELETIDEEQMEDHFSQ